MESETPKGWPKVRPVRRWLNFRGKQRPMAALGLTAFDAVYRVSDPGGCLENWEAELSAFEEAGFDFAALPRGLWKEPHLLGSLVGKTVESGLGCLLPLEEGRLPLPGTEEEGLLGDWARRQPGLLAWLPLDRLAFAEDLDPLIEGELHDACARQGVPLLLCCEDPFGRAGRMLREAGRTVDLTGYSCRSDEPFSPASLVPSCLAVRLQDRPAALFLAGGDPGRIRASFPLALGTGLGLLVLLPGSLQEGLPDLRGEDPRSWAALPGVMAEPFPEQAAVLVPEGGKERREELASQAFWLLQRETGVPARLLFQEEREPFPELVHLPLHGPMSPSLWMFVHALAAQGSQVLVTGLCLVGPETGGRLRALGIPERKVPGERQGRFPPRLRTPPVLDTGGELLSREIRRGALHFLDLGPEMVEAPEGGLLAGLARKAGLEPHPFLEGAGPLRRLLETTDGDFEIRLEGGGPGEAEIP